VLNRRWFRVEYLIFILAIVVRLIPGPRTVDDAYITFRYSQNFLNGNGLVYNPGEAVLGTTTPLYALLLSLMAALFGGSQAPYPILALALNALADGLTCLLLVQLGRCLGYPRAGIATSLLWALAPMSVTFAIGGMETSVYILTLMGSLYMYSTHRPVLTALLAAFSLLTRPDALLAILPLLLARTITIAQSPRDRSSLLEILAFSGPLAIWGLVSISSYGSPIPQSVSAKTIAYNLPGDAALIRLLQHFATPFQGNLLFGRYYIGFGLLVFPSLAILGWRRVVRKKRDLWPLAIFPLVYFMVFSFANPLIFRWYLTPPLPLFLLGLMIGLESVALDFKRITAFWIGTLFFLLLTLNAWTLHPDHGPNRPAPEMAYIKLEELYIQAVKDLKPHLLPGSQIAAGDIGAVGYFSQASILDMVGLISPITLEYFPLPEESYVINYAIPTELILTLKPDFIIMLEVYGRRTLLLDPVFQRTYSLFREYPTDIYGSQAMLVFERR
jgi:arabinofuranosyltransferase